MSDTSPEPNPDQKKHPPIESLSFQALSRELGETPPPARKKESAPPPRPPDAFPAAAPSASPGRSSFQDLFEEPEDRVVERPPEKSLEPGPLRVSISTEMQDRINGRVLSGSAPKSTPLWIQSLLVSIAACILFLFYRGVPAFSGIRWIVFLVSMLVSAGAVFWGGYGFKKGESELERRLCGVGLVLGVLATLGTILVRIVK